MRRARVQFGPPGREPVAEVERVVVNAKPAKPEKPIKPKKEKVRNDPQHVAAARELRDRYLEMLNGGLIPLPQTQAKYDVSRKALPAPVAPAQLPQLPEAA